MHRLHIESREKYRAWLRNERSTFAARYACASERSEKRGQYIVTEKLVADRYSVVYAARPKFFIPGEGDSVFEDAESAADDAEEAAEGKPPRPGASVPLEGRRHLPTYRLDVLSKAQLVQKCRRSGVDLVADLLESKRMRLALRSPFVSRLIDCFKDHCNLYFVTPDCRIGNLRQHIAMRAVPGRSGEFRHDETRFISAQLVLALEYMEKMRVVHRDIRSENVQFDNNGFVCLTDFTCARRLVDGRTFTLIGCPSVMAPEMLQCLFRMASSDNSLSYLAKLYPYCGYTNSVDYWALGLLIHEMAHGEPKFTADRSHSGLYKVVREMRELGQESTETLKQKYLQEQEQQQQSLSKQSSDKKQLNDLIAGLLNTRPTNRLGCGRGGVKELKGHPFFANINFVELHNRSCKPKYLPNPEVSVFNETEVHFDDIDCDQFDHFADDFDEF